MKFVCVDWDYSDTSLSIVEHHDEAEVLAVLALLEEYGGPDLVASGADMKIHGERQVCALAEVVSAYLMASAEKVRQPLFDALRVGLLRDAVEHAAGQCDRNILIAKDRKDARWAASLEAQANALRGALFLREQRDRIAADLAEMERIGAMTVEP